jgi:hypothetical protein
MSDTPPKNRYFGTYQAMQDEADQLIYEDEADSSDRAVISSFYNGRQTMSTAEADAQGVNELTNHLFGYDSMAVAKAQIESIYTKPEQVWSVKLPNVPLQIRQKWEMAVSRNFNTVIKKSSRLKPQIKTLAGDAVLFGSAFPMFRDMRDWCPKTMRPLVPRGTGTMSQDVPYAVVPSFLGLEELIRIYERHKRAAKRGLKTYWKGPTVASAIETLNGNVSKGNFIYADSRIQADEVEHQFQETKMLYAQYRTKLPVYYVYTSHPDKEGCPADLTILARYTPTQMAQADKEKRSMPTCLFECSELFDRAEHWLHPFFIDASIDGEMTWHRVMGLGRLNYDSDVDVEEFFNEAMQGSKENLRRTFKVAQQGDWELIKRWNDGEYASNLLPPGVDIAEMGKNPNFQYAFSTMEMLRAQSAKNAGTSYGGAQPPNNKKELQIQALERQGRNAETMGNRISDIYECFDRMGSEIYRRMLGESPLPLDPGYEEVKAFQELCRADGVPVEILRKLHQAGSFGTVVETNRTVGDGNQVREQMVNQFLMQSIHMYSPEAQELIKRRVTASMTRDYGFAEAIVPFQQKPDANQVERARTENSSCLEQGITGFVPETSADDIDATHLKVHLPAMQALLAKGKVGNKGWDEMDLAGFKSLGSHSAIHIQRIAQNPDAKQMATQLMQTLQGIAKQGQEFANNLAKQREAVQVDPVEQAKLEIANQKEQLNFRKQVALEKHRKAVLQLQERKAATGEVVAAAQLANAERQTSHKIHMDKIDKAQKHLDMAHELLQNRSMERLQRDQMAQNQSQFDAGQEDEEEPQEQPEEVAA